MSSTAMIYWLTRLDGIVIFIGIVAAIYMCFILALLFLTIEEYDDETKKLYHKKIKRNLIFVAIIWVIFVLTPNTKEMMIIYVGGKTVDYVKGDSSLRAIPSKTTELIFKKIEKEIDELDAISKIKKNEKEDESE